MIVFYFMPHIITVKILFCIIKSVQSKGNLCKIIGLQCIFSRFNSVLSSLFGDADNFDANKRLLTLLKVEFKRVKTCFPFKWSSYYVLSQFYIINYTYKNVKKMLNTCTVGEFWN